MFWSIVGALLFFFVGIPLLVKLAVMLFELVEQAQDFWRLPTNRKRRE